MKKPWRKWEKIGTDPIIVRRDGVKVEKERRENRVRPALYRTSEVTPEDGEVVGQDAQTDFAILTVIGSGSQGCTHVSLEHAEDGFDLPTLAIGFLGESLLHQLAISSPRRPGLAIESRPAAIRGWDDTANAEFVATESMESFGFVSGVPQESRETLAIQRFV